MGMLWQSRVAEEATFEWRPDGGGASVSPSAASLGLPGLLKARMKQFWPRDNTSSKPPLHKTTKTGSSGPERRSCQPAGAATGWVLRVGVRGVRGRKGERRKALILTMTSSYVPSCFPAPGPGSVWSRAHSWPDPSGQEENQEGCVTWASCRHGSDPPGADRQRWAKWARLSPSPGPSPSKPPDPDVLGGRNMVQPCLDGSSGRGWLWDSHQA